MLLSSAGVVFVAELAVWATHIAQHTDAVLLPHSVGSPASSKQLIMHKRLLFALPSFVLLFSPSLFWLVCIYHFLMHQLSPALLQRRVAEALSPVWGHLPSELWPVQVRGACGEPLEGVSHVQRAVPLRLRPAAVREARAHSFWWQHTQLRLDQPERKIFTTFILNSFLSPRNCSC